MALATLLILLASVVAWAQYAPSAVSRPESGVRSSGRPAVLTALAASPGTLVALDRQDRDQDYVERLERRISELERRLERHRERPGLVRRTAGVFGDLVGLAITGLLFAGIAYLGVRVAPELLGRARDMGRSEPARSGLVGLAVAFGWLPLYVVGTIALVLTIVGIALVPIWLLVVPATLGFLALCGLIVSALWAGGLVWPEAEAADAAARGAVILLVPAAAAHVLSLMPVFGGLFMAMATFVLFVAGLTGAGALFRALVARQRRR